MQYTEKISSGSPETLLEKISPATDNTVDRDLHLKVALIDYTLSRAYCSDSNCGDTSQFMQLDDPALFSGKGMLQEITTSNGFLLI